MQPTTTNLPATTGDDALDGLADLLPQVWQDVVVDTIREVHRAVADRAFGVVPGSQPIKVVHDGVADAVYGTLRMAGTGAKTALRAVVRAGATTRDPAMLERSRGWRSSVAILNGVLGDLLDEQRNPLAIQMAPRVGGRDVRMSREGLAAAYPEATGRVAVFVHGLVENEESWQFRAAERGGTYPELLARAGITPVLVRFNTGKHISDNALEMADLLDRLVDRWPVPVEEMLLVGHSMGGLVLRGAADIGAASGLGWTGLVRNVVLLGTPNEGAVLEKVANAGAWMLATVPEMAPFGAILKRRSAGIKDLRHGYVRASDWAEQDPDGRRSRTASDTEPWEGVTIHNIGATITHDHTHPMGHALGDLLVRWDSARADGRPWARSASVTHVGGTDHFGLLNHPVVSDLLADLTMGRPPTT